MAIIIREKKIIEGKEYKVEVYKVRPGRLVTNDEKKKAEQFDQYLKNKIKEIEKEMEDKKLFLLKGKKGKVCKLWYEVGKSLEFVMDTSLVSADEREYVWRAIYDYVRKLHTGEIPERAKRDPNTSHFCYCYKLSRFPWHFVAMAGDWTSWSEFFDRRETKDDPRIIEWLGKRAKKNNIAGRQNWLRPLTKAIHGEFKNKDTIIFSRDELYKRLDDIFSEMKKNEQN